MISILFLGLLSFASYTFADGEQLNKQVYCTPSNNPHQYNVGLAFAAPYKGTYNELPAADGTTYVSVHVEIYDHTCSSPVYTNDVAWNDVNTTVYMPNRMTTVSVQFPVWPNWRRYGKQCFGYSTPVFSLEALEEECENYESVYHCDSSSMQDSSFCSIKRGNLTIQTDYSGMNGIQSLTQYSRLFKYARTDVGDACNCWQEMDGYNYVFACGCAVSTDFNAHLPGLTPPDQTYMENNAQVHNIVVDPASTIAASHQTGGPGPVAVTYSSSTMTTVSIAMTHSKSHSTTSKSATSTKPHKTTTPHSTKSPSVSQSTISTKPHGSKSHTTLASTTRGKTSLTAFETASRSGKTSPAITSSSHPVASLCSLSPVWGTLVEVCSKEAHSNSHPNPTACSLVVISGTPVEKCAKETAA